MWMDGGKTIFQGVGEDYCQGSVWGGEQCYVRGIMLWDGMKEQERFSVGLRIEKNYKMIEQEKNAVKVSGG